LASVALNLFPGLIPVGVSLFGSLRRAARHHATDSRRRLPPSPPGERSDLRTVALQMHAGPFGLW